MNAKLWILRIADGLLTLLGEILVFFGAYAFVSSQSLTLMGAGIFVLLLGQMAGVNAMKYEEKKRLLYLGMEILENIGRQFAYPLLVALVYLMIKSQLLLTLAFALTLIALIKSVFIVYKGYAAEAMVE